VSGADPRWLTQTKEYPYFNVPDAAKAVSNVDFKK
jgi:hypothetical protein